MIQTISASSLAHCAAESLETMFLTSMMGEAEAAAADAHVAATVSYRGDASGMLTVALSAAAASAVASAFLGISEDDITRQDKVDVIIELTNVLCGTTLSTLFPDGHIELATPVLAPAAETAAASCKAYELDAGVLWLGLS